MDLRTGITNLTCEEDLRIGLASWSLAPPSDAADRRQLLERVREQEGVIRRLWDRYTQDVGHEPSVDDIASLGDRRVVPARAEIVRTVLEKGQTFEDAVEQFEFEWTHSRAEVSTQRVASTLMHTRRPAVVARKTGDLVLSGFWGRGVSMPIFERLLQKLKGLNHGSLRKVDLSDNGLNGNFVPGLIELLRRGARQLDVSQNQIESPAMQQLCNALPHIAQNLDALDLRFNPCSQDPAFVHCVAGVAQEMKYLTRLGVTVRAPPEETRASSMVASARHSESRAAPQRRQSSKSRHRESSTPQRSHLTTASRCGRSVSVSDPHSYRIRSSSFSGRPSSGDIGRSASEIGSAAAGGATPCVASNDSAASLFRGLASCQQLRALDLRSSQLSPAAAQRLAQLVRGDHLIVLGLADCFLGEAVEPLLEAVAACHNLVCLNLRLNAISGQTGSVLAMALAESVSLTEADLASNELGDDFGVALARVLAFDEVLWKIDLGRNPLGMRTGDALLDTLRRRNSTLISVGDTVNGLYGLGARNRYKIQCHLDANRQGFDAAGGGGPPSKAAGAMDPSLLDFEWRILHDEPPMFEPLVLLG